LNELLGVCSLLNIPFVVIVQAHLLKDKGAVRLRRVLSDDLTVGWHVGSSGHNERFVPLESLASTIREMSAETSGSDERVSEELLEESNGPYPRDSAVTRGSSAEIESFYVDQEQYFCDDIKVSKTDTPHWKGVLKALKSVAQRSESYLTSQMNALGSTPVFGVSDLPFLVLRDFGTALMRRERTEQSAMGASIEVTERYPKGKRALKTLAMAVDYCMKKRGVWDPSTAARAHSPSRGHSPARGSSGGSQLLTVLLYSKLDDRFDMVSLEGGPPTAATHAASRKR